MSQRDAAMAETDWEAEYWKVQEQHTKLVQALAKAFAVLKQELGDEACERYISRETDEPDEQAGHRSDRVYFNHRVWITSAEDNCLSLERERTRKRLERFIADYKAAHPDIIRSHGWGMFGRTYHIWAYKDLTALITEQEGLDCRTERRV
jgi:hypothetical protein